MSSESPESCTNLISLYCGKGSGLQRGYNSNINLSTTYTTCFFKELGCKRLIETPLNVITLSLRQNKFLTSYYICNAGILTYFPYFFLFCKNVIHFLIIIQQCGNLPGKMVVTQTHFCFPFKTEIDIIIKPASKNKQMHAPVHLFPERFQSTKQQTTVCISQNASILCLL